MTTKNNIFLNLAIILLFTTTLTSSNIDLITEYKNNGIKNIEEKLDKELTTLSYWENFLKNVNTQFGYIESYDNILTCNKKESKLNIYIKDQNSSKYKIMKEYHAYTGKMEGDKVKEGDLKTPVGIYKLIKKIEKVDPFYGPLAFVTSYPNDYDKYRDKTGQGIWIHGLPLNQERDEYTKGCIAINNENIECLDRHIDISKTILLIDEHDIKMKTSKETLSKILSQLYLWRYSWIYNDLNMYLSFYDDAFKRFDGMSKTEFTKYKTRIFQKDEKKTIIFTDLNVIPYPDTDDLYKITFNEHYKSDSFSFNGEKTLIIQYKHNKISIITER